MFTFQRLPSLARVVGKISSDAVDAMNGKTTVLPDDWQPRARTRWDDEVIHVSSRRDGNGAMVREAGQAAPVA